LEKWVVYVTGEVARPGVYEVTPGSRVNDAVRLAGGFTAGADREAVNLAEKLADEDHIAVPGFLSQDGEDSGVRRGEATASPRRPAKGDERLDINAASASELTSLPGIGPKLAEAIVSYRERNGRFESVDDLRLVGGIGEKRLEAVRELVRAGK
jgi:competence protein ComEA